MFLPFGLIGGTRAHLAMKVRVKEWAAAAGLSRPQGQLGCGLGQKKGKGKRANATG